MVESGVGAAGSARGLSRQVGFAFVGAGRVAELHRAALQRLQPWARLLGVFDQDAGVREQRSREWSVRAFGSLDELLAAPGVDVVSVLSPVTEHAAHTRAALETGHDVLVEKPVGVSVAEVEGIRRAASASGRRVFPGHNYAYDPAVRRARRLIALGRMGPVVCAWLNYAVSHTPELQARYPGVIAQIMTHHAYLSLHLLGRPAQVCALSARFGRDGEVPGGERASADQRENQAAVLLGYVGGAVASLFATFAVTDRSAQPGPFTVKVLAERGSFLFNWHDAVVDAATGFAGQDYAIYEDSFFYELEYIVQHCLPGGVDPISTIEDAVDAARVVAEAQGAAADGLRRTIRWG